MLVDRQLLSIYSQTVVDAHVRSLTNPFFGVPSLFDFYVSLVLVRAKHIDSEELDKGITLYVSRKVERVIGKRIWR